MKIKKRITGFAMSAILLLTLLCPWASGADVHAVSQASTKKYEATGDVENHAVRLTKKNEQSLNQLFAKNAAALGSTNINSVGDEYISGKYGYDLLSEAQQALYDDFADAVKAYVNSENFTSLDYTKSSEWYRSDAKQYAVVQMEKSYEEYGCTAEESMQVYFTFRHNNPQYFWISTSYYMGASKLTVLMDPFFATADSRMQAQDAIQTGVSQFAALTTGCKTNYEKVRVVHDAIIKKAEYAWTSKGNPVAEIWAHCVAGVFVKYHKDGTEYGAVCEGYSKTLQLVLNQIGVENVYIVGVANGGDHAWNAVKLDNGTYYYVDSTWDDYGADSYGGIIYTNFCVPKSYFEKKHTAYTPAGSAMSARANWLYKLPVIGNTLEYTYYAREHAYFEDVATEAEADILLGEAGARVKDEYMQVICTDKDTMTYVCWAWDVKTYYSYPGLGYLVIARAGKYAIRKPTTSISIAPETTEVNKGDEITLTATLSAGSDDRVSWVIEGEPRNFLSSTAGMSVEATFHQVGTVKVTATAYGGNKSATCTVTVKDPTQMEGHSAVAWANGKNYIKKIGMNITPEIWKTYSGNVPLKGKLGWLVLSAPTELEFDKSTKVLLTKATAEEKRMASISTNGMLTAKQPGTYYIHFYDTGTVANGKATVGTVKMTVPREEAQTKTVQLKASIKPTNWYNTNHKLQKGRILWIAKKERTNIEFNKARRTLATKTNASDKYIGTVNSKGIVTAKNAGTLYVYACDTGSMHVEEFTVKIKNAPSAVKLSKAADSTSSTNAIKQVSLNVGEESTPIYVIGTYNKKKVDADTTYTISVQEKYKDYLKVNKTTCKNGESFVISAKDTDKTPDSSLRITVKVTNNQSKKSKSCVVNLTK